MEAWDARKIQIHTANLTEIRQGQWFSTFLCSSLTDSLTSSRSQNFNYRLFLKFNILDISIEELSLQIKRGDPFFAEIAFHASCFFLHSMVHIQTHTETLKWFCKLYDKILPPSNQSFSSQFLPRTNSLPRKNTSFLEGQVAPDGEPPG